MYFGEPILSMIKIPYCILKYIMAFVMFPFFRRRVGKLTVSTAHKLGVESAMNWQARQPATVRELYQWL